MEDNVARGDVGCPSLHELHVFANGKIADPVRKGELARHVAECQQCADQLYIADNWEDDSI